MSHPYLIFLFAYDILSLAHSDVTDGAEPGGAGRFVFGRGRGFYGRGRV